MFPTDDKAHMFSYYKSTWHSYNSQVQVSLMVLGLLKMNLKKKKKSLQLINNKGMFLYFCQNTAKNKVYLLIASKLTIAL